MMTTKVKKLSAAQAIAALKKAHTDGTLPGIARGRCWLVIGPHVWGKAFSIEQAWDNADNPKAFVLLDAPPCVYVDEMGGVCWFPHLYATQEQATQDGKYPDAHSIGYKATALRVFKDGVLSAPDEQEPT